MGIELNWMDEAFAEAETARDADEVPVGAVIVHQGRVIGRGSNRRENDNDPIAHAEIHAIQQAAQYLGSWRLSDCELWVTLEPCLMCLGAAQQSRLQRVVYGARDLKGGAISLGYEFQNDLRLNHRFDVSLQEESRCGEILSEFFKTKRRLSKPNHK